VWYLDIRKFQFIWELFIPQLMQKYNSYTLILLTTTYVYQIYIIIILSRLLF